ncbi:very long chain fatty acid elongase 4-like isoform X2 [Dysidea avara]|uniref:very long chain fatty acid elongase 4-like isoform X2 n=1 Tax=Dysidea avara TaxID=196820 RepID=UPI003322A4AD
MASTRLVDEIGVLMQHPMAFYEEIIHRSDPRVKDWLWMQSPIPTVLLCALYLLCVAVGPRVMKNREPFDLRRVLIIYNFALVALSGYIVYQLVTLSIEAGYNYICQPMSYSTEPVHVGIAAALWWYYFSKFVEFFDTIFFILRKKNNQISFLHVYHHTSMFFLWWIGIKWVAGGQSLMGALANSVVHLIMYTYYGFSAFGPSVQKYIGKYKKRVTQLQLVQFVGALIHGSNSLYIDCNFPKWMHYILLGYATSFVILFTNFYVIAYTKKSDKSASKTSEGVRIQNGSVPTSEDAKKHD